MPLCTEQTMRTAAGTLTLFPTSREKQMTTDPSNNGNDAAHLSDQDAALIARYESAPALAEFVAALNMQRPVTSNRAARLLEHIIKETMSATVDLVEGQMRTDHWEKDLAPGETLPEVAARAQAFLETPAGVELFNFFARTFARTTGEMFDSSSPHAGHVGHVGRRVDG
jgi:hypothetical protein